VQGLKRFLNFFFENLFISHSPNQKRKHKINYAKEKDENTSSAIIFMALITIFPLAIAQAKTF
jgi:hypothetical protein